MLGFDKLIVYKLVSELRKFYREYSINLGGGSLSAELVAKYMTQDGRKLVDNLRLMDKNIKGNYESLDSDHLKAYV